AGATGYAEIKRALPATLRSRYRAGSVAKPITAVAMIGLVDAGKLVLAAPISTYVEGAPTHLQSLTAKLPASHRAGERHCRRTSAWWMGWHENYSNHQYDTVAAGLTMVVEDALRCAPGTGFQYTTSAYSLLLRDLGGAADQDFASLLDTWVFEPVGMLDTGVDIAAPMPVRMAFHQGEDGRCTPPYPYDSSYRISGGGLVTTPIDLVHLGPALLGKELLSKAATRELWTPLGLADGSKKPENYASGWRVDDSVRLLGEVRPVPILHHGGTQPGAAAFFVLLPEHGIVVAAMSDSGASGARAEVQKAVHALARLARAQIEASLCKER
ncbi:MAG: serine hydrolase domain-containing protein, partial [Dokdonella sp.]